MRTEHEYFFHPSWPVLFTDNHLLVLYKPAGLLVQGDVTGEVSLLDLGKRWIQERCGKPGKVFLALVHRLDRPVAGVVLFCRTSKAADRISRQFREGEARKTYLAVVEGRPEKSEARLVHQLERREGRSSRVVPGPTPESQEARLSYKVLDAREGKSLLEVRLETGRHHQIRVQLAHLGCPILGDLRYGASAPVPGKPIALLARELVVRHPVRQEEELVFRAPLPQGWPWPGGEGEIVKIPWNWRELAPLCGEGMRMSQPQPVETQ